MRRTLVSDRGCDLGPPVWAHTGLIAFVAECGSRGPRLDVVDSSGRHRRTLLEGSFYSNISWSLDGKRFAYGDGTLRVAVVGGTSSAVFRIPPGADGSPAWSPDGKRIAATLNDNPSVPELLKSPVGSPAWSPDGRYLVGIQGEGADFVVLVDLLTNDESTIYTDEGIGYVSLGDPAWSPDGRLIAFSVLDSGEITFYDVDRGDFVDLGKTITGQDPAWSPDGTRLAYDTVSASHPDARSSVFTARPDGTAVKRIAVNASGPAWSPDGKEIVFVRSLDGNRELYVMRADGTEQRRLTFNAGLDTAPDWQPLPVTP